jgi:menaquinone-9 beta-reductase
MDDVVVAGGGPAGAIAAIVLARAGVRVRLFERATFPRRKLCGDTLNPGAMRVLEQLVPVGRLLASALPLEGMLLTGPGGIEIRGRYGDGVVGRSIGRRELDVVLLEHAAAAGAHVEMAVGVTAPLLRDGVVAGVLAASHGCGARSPHPARLVIAADGRESRLARALGLLRHPRRPRRWAIGAYFEGVEGLTPLGEMHVRAGHYIGVAPMPDGLANACLVVPHEGGGRGWRSPADALLAAVRRDPALSARFAHARMIDAPHVLGPMAVEASAAGVPGLLLAGDAAGFIDPMTGDGLRFAIAGAAMAAREALEVLAGHSSPEAAIGRLARRRQVYFAAKWRFNRSLRALVGSRVAVGAATSLARLAPSAFQAIIRYAGDCNGNLPSERFP